MVESGNKLVVEARMKGAGMHWAEPNVNPVLAIRNILCSDRWKEDWPQIECRLRQQTTLQRRKLHQSRVKTASSVMPKPVLQKNISKRTGASEVPKKTKTNPWRNFKFGRALYQRPAPPKL
jgi:hypothetical protein